MNVREQIVNDGGERLVDHSFHGHVSDTLELVVDDQLWDQLSLWTSGQQ